MIQPNELDVLDAQLVSRFEDKPARTITLVFAMTGRRKSNGVPDVYWAWSRVDMVSGEGRSHGRMTQEEWVECERISQRIAFNGEPYSNEKHSRIVISSFYAEALDVMQRQLGGDSL